MCWCERGGEAAYQLVQQLMIQRDLCLKLAQQMSLLHIENIAKMKFNPTNNTYLLYLAWATQRHCQCCIRHTALFLNGP